MVLYICWTRYYSIQLVDYGFDKAQPTSGEKVENNTKVLVVCVACTRKRRPKPLRGLCSY